MHTIGTNQIREQLGKYIFLLKEGKIFKNRKNILS